MSEAFWTLIDRGATLTALRNDVRMAIDEFLDAHPGVTSEAQKQAIVDRAMAAIEPSPELSDFGMARRRLQYGALLGGSNAD